MIEILKEIVPFFKMMIGFVVELVSQFFIKSHINNLIIYGILLLVLGISIVSKAQKRKIYGVASLIGSLISFLVAASKQ